MPRINLEDREENFEFNIPEYMFYFGDKNEVELKRIKNKVKRINSKNFNGNYWEYTKKKILWSRKNDKIKNELDFDFNILNDRKNIEKNKAKDNLELDLSYKPKIFEKINKFEKYDALKSVE